MDRDDRLAFYMGYLLGSMTSRDVIEYFVNRGVSQLTVETVAQGLAEMSVAFYKDR
jgi:hypothetical protein